MEEFCLNCIGGEGKVAHSCALWSTLSAPLYPTAPVGLKLRGRFSPARIPRLHEVAGPYEGSYVACQY